MFQLIRRSCRHLFNRRCSSLVDTDSDKIYEDLLRKSYLLPENGHNVLIIQPRSKGTFPSKIRNKSILFKKDPNVDEAISLVDSLEFWTIVDVIFCNLKVSNTNGRTFFSKGVWEDVSKTVIAYRDGKQQSIQAYDILPKQENSTSSDRLVRMRATAVLINWSRLTTLQLAFMQETWLMPVYDRYTLVVQLFNLRSRTPEAKVQAQLAEIGLLRARVPAFFQTPNMISCLVDRSDFTTKERLLKILNEREISLLNKLERISKQRIHHKRSHKREMEKHHLPLVAVVGYTNAGKTSLIRYLSKSTKLTSSPEVFATLDITHHRTRLPPMLPNKIVENSPSCDQLSSSSGSSSIGLPGIQMLLLDTIGFMSDLPTNLLAAFRATLYECIESDLILHIVDVSQPDWQLQVNHVEKLLCDIGILASRPTNFGHTNNSEAFDEGPEVLKIGNKLDQMQRNESNNAYTGFDALISAKTGIGMYELTSKIQLAIMKRLGWFSRTLDIRQGSPSLPWIYSNAMVTNVDASPSSSERLRITAVFTPVTWIKFRSTFQMVSSSNSS